MTGLEVSNSNSSSDKRVVDGSSVAPPPAVGSESKYEPAKGLPSKSL